MPIAEEAIPTSILENVKGAAIEGASLVDVSADDAPIEIITAINAYVTKHSRKSNGVDNSTDRALPVGTLWGEQLVREFGWEWASTCVDGDKSSKAIGVFAKNRALGVYPWNHIFQCLEHGGHPRILLAYNMLKDKRKIPDLPPRGYLDLMDHVHYIVPPA